MSGYIISHSLDFSSKQQLSLAISDILRHLLTFSINLHKSPIIICNLWKFLAILSIQGYPNTFGFFNITCACTFRRLPTSAGDCRHFYGVCRHLYGVYRHLYSVYRHLYGVYRHLYGVYRYLYGVCRHLYGKP